jgi:hypothetical protein
MRVLAALNCVSFLLTGAGGTSALPEALRADARLAAEYGRLKRQLAARFGSDREGYNSAKTEFIRTVLSQAADKAEAGRLVLQL